MKPKKLSLSLLAFLLLAGCSFDPTATDISSSFPTSDTGGESSESPNSSSKPSTNTPDSSKGDSSNSSSSHQPDTSDYVWKVDRSTFGNTFRGDLQKAIKASGNRTIGYSSNNEVLAQSDKSPQGGIVPFYHPMTDHTTDWNKEHCWPNSRGAGKTGPGADPQMLRPTWTKDNSSRSNYFYGLPSDTGNTWDPASLGYEPARGESARIIFYCAVKYFNTCGTGGTSNGNKPLELSNNPSDDKNEHTMGKLNRLIEWNNRYPVTEMEIKRNNYLHSQGFSRNPFIDSPDLANYIWTTEGIRTTPYYSTTDPVDPSDPENPTDPTPDPKYTYQRVESLDEIKNGDEVLIAAKESGSTVVLKDTAKSVTLPWYLLSDPVNFDENLIKTDEILTKFTVSKENTMYQFSTSKGKLFNYIDVTHYSIGIADTPTNSGSNNWSLSIQNGVVEFKGEKEVYLTYTEKYGTFSGAKAKAAEIYLYKAL